MEKKVDFQKAESADFKNHILYVIPSEPNSEKALAMVRENGLDADMWVQDLRMLRPPLPAWLDGVPTLVPRSEGKAYKGSSCLRYLEQKCASVPQGYISGTTQSMAHSFDDGSSVTRFESVEPTTAGTSRHGMTDFDQSERVKDDEIERYMQLRQSQSEVFKQDPDAQAIVAT